MQYRLSLLGALGLSGAVLGAYVPSEPWSTLTPSGSLAGTVTDYTQTFGIAINPVATASPALSKRGEASQISDGQPQAASGTPVISQITDGQIQATTATTKAVVSQITDGQIQATTATTKAVVSQITDGQVQATTATTKAVVSQITDGQIQATTSAAQIVSQIGDGQIQATTSTAQIVSQIGDGQIQATTTTTGAVSQITDGQVQATKATTSGASQITDGQVQASQTASASSGPVDKVSCLSDSSLAMTLKGSILTDSKGRIGSIVANRQFQFDGPPPQAGAIYAAGWSITNDGKLAIGNTTVFYQCLSGTFYNLYDENIGSKCEAVNLDVVDLVSC